MRIATAFGVAFLLYMATACSPRDFLTRRLAADLIAGAQVFREPQFFWLRTGTVSNREFNSPESLVLQRRGWIIGTDAKCPPAVEPPPCWDIVLSPLGVEAFRPLLRVVPPANGLTAVQVARREVTEITGISKAGNFADVEFTWHWAPMNEVGAALYDSGVRYRSSVAFRRYDDGWRVVTEADRSNQSLDDALRSAQPAR